jgi:hypothetical protein
MSFSAAGRKNEKNLYREKYSKKEHLCKKKSSAAHTCPLLFVVAS